MHDFVYELKIITNNNFNQSLINLSNTVDNTTFNTKYILPTQTILPNVKKIKFTNISPAIQFLNNAPITIAKIVIPELLPASQRLHCWKEEKIIYKK